MIKLVVAADDFTGALDTGVQFAKQGIQTWVTTHVDVNFNSIDGDIEVLVVDTETRHKSSDEAYKVVFKLIKEATDFGIKHIYKKTDSVLRGNIGSELLGAMEGADCDHLMFVPAFPDNDRTTENGIQYVSGVPIAETHFAKDPFTPVCESFIPDIIGQCASVKMTIVKAWEIRESKKGIGEAIEIERVKEDSETIKMVGAEEAGEVVDFNKGCGIFIFDAKTNDELVSIGKILTESNQTRLMAGCAGFAGILHTILDFSKKAPEPVIPGNNILLVSGSVNDTAIEQMGYAKQIGFKGISLTPEQKLNRIYKKSSLQEKQPQCKELIRKVNDILEHNKLAYIEAVESRGDMEKTNQYAVEDVDTDIESIRTLITENIGEIVKQVVDNCKIDNLFVFGGDTLLGITKKLDIKNILPMFEIGSGIVVSKIISDKYSFNIITKAGGLGGKDAAEMVVKRLLYNPKETHSEL